MTLSYDERIVNDRKIETEEDFYGTNFIGYLNPIGVPIDYSRPFGLGGHDSNPTTDIFEAYMMFQINNPEKYDEFYSKSKYKKWEEEDTKYKRNHLYEAQIKDILEYRAEYGRYGSSYDCIDKYTMLDYDMYMFLYNCYSNRYFSTGFNGDNLIMSEAEFFEKFFKPIDEERKRLYPKSIGNMEYMEWNVPSYYHFDTHYYMYKRKRILEILKYVMISYMGYHYVARTPRTICTSEHNINETFYNYLLNDFNIIRMPKMIYNPSLKIYEQYKNNSFLISESEEKLGMEISSIRKRIKKDERVNFYR